MLWHGAHSPVGRIHHSILGVARTRQGMPVRQRAKECLPTHSRLRLLTSHIMGLHSLVMEWPLTVLAVMLAVQRVTFEKLVSVDVQHFFVGN